MAFRTADFEFFNMTSHTLVRTETRLDHGEFTDGAHPPTTIGPHIGVRWKAQSDGFLTGTEGEVGYAVGNSGVTVKFRWNVPAAGQSGGFFLTEGDAAGQFLFVARNFGFPLGSDVAPGLYASGPVESAGPIVFPFQLNPAGDITVSIGLRDRTEDFSIQDWLRAQGLDPRQGVKAAGARHDRPNFSVRTLIGPPRDWNAPIMP